jgi:hypothetical protein
MDILEYTGLIIHVKIKWHQWGKPAPSIQAYDLKRRIALL